MTQPNNSMKILFISLGCDKNLVDSERMLGKLAAPLSALGGPIGAVVAALGALIATSPELQSSFGSVLSRLCSIVSLSFCAQC